MEPSPSPLPVLLGLPRAKEGWVPVTQEEPAPKTEEASTPMMETPEKVAAPAKVVETPAKVEAPAKVATSCRGYVFEESRKQRLEDMFEFDRDHPGISLTPYGWSPRPGFPKPGGFLGACWVCTVCGGSRDFRQPKCPKVIKKTWQWREVAEPPPLCSCE